MTAKAGSGAAVRRRGRVGRSIAGVALATAAVGGLLGVVGAGTAAAAAPPVVTSISPPVGPIGGGTVVTVRGWGFATGDTVSFGSTTLPSYETEVLSPTMLLALSPAGSAGSVPVTVTSGGAGRAFGNRFTYSANPTPGCTAGMLRGATKLCIDTPAPGGSLLVAPNNGFGLTLRASMFPGGAIWAPPTNIDLAQANLPEFPGGLTTTPMGPVVGHLDLAAGSLRLSMPLAYAAWFNVEGYILKRAVVLSSVSATLTVSPSSAIAGTTEYTGTLTGGTPAWNVPIDVFVASSRS